MALSIEQALVRILSEENKDQLSRVAKEVLIDFEQVRAYRTTQDSQLLDRLSARLDRVADELSKEGIKIRIGDFLRLRKDYLLPKLEDDRWGELERELERLTGSKSSNSRPCPHSKAC